MKTIEKKITVLNKTLCNKASLIKVRCLPIVVLLHFILAYSPGITAQSRMAVIKHNNPSYVPINDSISSDSFFNSVLALCKVSKYKKIYPGRALDELFGDLFIMECSDTNGFPVMGLDSMLTLDSISEIFFLNDAYELSCSNPMPFNDPYKDQSGVSFSSDYTWALDATDAACGWNFTTGTIHTFNPPLLAVIEGNVDRNHTELHPSLMDFRVLNSFIPPNPGVDYATSVQGHHGTSIIGSALAATNNGFGITSVGHSIKCNHFEYYSPAADIVDAETAFKCILDAIDKGSKIINCSFTSIFDNVVYGQNYTPTNFLKEMVLTKNVTFVFAAGNWNGVPGSQNELNDGKYEFTENIPGVIVVGGINKDLKCQFGTNARYSIGFHVDLCAPAKNIIGIRSIIPNDPSQFEVASGTSTAAPMVAATIALMLDLKPDLTPPEIECILKATTNPIADYNDFIVNGKSKVGTGRLSVFNALQYVSNLLAIKENAVNITTSVTWNTTKFLDHDIFIKNGGNLTINSTTIKFAPGANIIVEQGGKLTVNNSTLTNSVECISQPGYITKLWGGIVITSHGSNQSQNTSSSGFVDVLNNSVIENAHIGIGTGDWISGSTGGGIIHADGSSFKNCRYGIVMGFYLDPINIELNLTKCNNVDFINDKPLVEYKMQSGNTQVWLGSVRGVKFHGCKFSNSVPGSGIRGIGAWDCKIWVTNGFGNIASGSCPNHPLGRQSEFINLGIGIHSVGSNVTFNRLQAVSAKFLNCKHGIWMGTDQLTEIIACDFDNNNDFTFPPADPMSYPTFHHIYSNESTGFTVADSKFDFNLNSSQGSAYLVALKTYKANAGYLSNTIFNAEVAKCRFENTNSTYPTYGQIFWGLNYDFYMYCNYYSGKFYRAWTGYDGSYLNSQRGKKKSSYTTTNNNNIYNNNLFDACINSNISIQGIPNQLFIETRDLNNNPGPFQYFADGTGFAHAGTPNSQKYAVGTCLNTAVTAYIVNGWNQQCDFNNSLPWFNTEDIFCRDPLYPLIPLRNASVVTAWAPDRTITGEEEPLYDTSNIHDISQNQNAFFLNSFMLKYNYNIADISTRNPDVRKQIYDNLSTYTTEEKLAAYEILIHWYFEDVNAVHQIFSEKEPVDSEDIDNTTGLSEINSRKFEIYPVPSNTGTITIKSNLDYDKVEVYDMLGTLVSTYVEGDLSAIKLRSNGIYFVKIYYNSILQYQTKVVITDL